MFFNNVSHVLPCLEQIQAELESHELFYGHGTDNAWDEACWLVQAVLRKDGVKEFEKETPVNAAQLQQITDILMRRIKERTPLAYLLNEAWFAGLAFYVDERVLVPRSPIAELIDQSFEPLISTPPNRILDLCSGSGCIGIACALAFPDAIVDLADLSQAALAVAEINIKRFELEGRVSIIESNLFDAINNSYDLIVSNPPYVSQDEYDELPAEYHNEPVLGLVSLNNGLAIPSQILQESANYLTDQGVLVLEVGYSWQALDKYLPSFPFLWIDFELGGEGVCFLNKRQIQQGIAGSSKT